MKLMQTLTAAATVCAVMMTVASAQQVPLPTTAAQVPGPAPGTAMTKPYVQMVARMAYLWGWPLVNAANRAVAFSKAPRTRAARWCRSHRLQPPCDADRICLAG
jgi:hypothetical protein